MCKRDTVIGGARQLTETPECKGDTVRDGA